MITGEQIAVWQSDLEKEQSDEAWSQATHAWRAARSPQVLDALRKHLSAFLDGLISLPEFQSTFDKKTRTEWDVFGLKGLSGAMFLNTLVKHMPDQQKTDAALKIALPAPTNGDEGRQRMNAFVATIESEISSGTVTRAQVQTARIPYFLSAWWHIQKPADWPIYYFSMRRMFDQRNLWHADHNSLSEDYLAFRETVFSLSESLNVDPWRVERLCLWLDQAVQASTLKPEKPKTSTPARSKDHDSPPSLLDNPELATAGSLHTQAQWLLAQLGKKFNLKVWIAQNDQSRMWEGEKLGAYSLPNLPVLGIGDPAQKLVRLIDVIWLKGGTQVVAAFEVEHTTSIFSGLLRMSDLTVLAPNTVFPIYIVAPEQKMNKVREQLRRPTFQRIELHQRCRFFSMERLFQDAPAILKWANNPSVIDQLAERVGDVDEEAMPILNDDALD